MLSRLRSYFSKFTVPVALFLIKVGLRANTITVLALIIALMYPVLIFMLPTDYHLYSTFLILISGILDSIDGTIARMMRETSKLGAFLDSISDRVSDMAYVCGLLISKITTPIEAILLLSGSMLISYTRAKYESLIEENGIEGIGICERAERVLFIFIIASVYYLNQLISRIVLYLLLLLIGVTIVQRVLFVIGKLRGKK